MENMQVKGSNEGLESSLIEIFEDLSKEEGFSKALEQIIDAIDEGSVDLSRLQTEIVILIKNYLGRIKDRKKKLKKIDEVALGQNIAELSNHLMKEYSDVAKKAMHDFDNPKDQHQFITKESRNNFNRIIKNFAVYQIYKVMNPRRIAGESRKDNFAHNMVVGGMDRAKKYTGGSKEEIAKHSPKLVEQLENKHNMFKKQGKLVLGK